MATDISYDSLYKRMCEAIDFKGRWLALYQDLYRFVIPDRNAFNIRFGYRDDGLPTTNEIWDNTAMIAANQRANDLHSLLLPQDRKWGRFTANPLQMSKQVTQYYQPQLDQTNQIIQWHIERSNLARVASSSNLDLVGGTAGMWIESISDYTPIQFRSIPAIALFIEYCTDDVLYNGWYQLPLTGRYIKETFPNYKGKMLQDFMTNPNKSYTVYYGQIKMDENHFFIYSVLEDDPFNPLWETERSYQQILIYRDRVRPGEADGRGIGLDMLPTIRDLNRICMYRRKSFAFKAWPTFFCDPGTTFNPYTVQQWGGAQIIRKTPGKNPVEPMQMPDTPEVFEEIQFYQQIIKDAFHVDPLGDVTLPKMSATEVAERQNEAQRTSATDISRLINEFPKQIYEISAKILAERNLLNFKVGAPVHKLINESFLNFDYQSPLYELQNETDLQNFQQSLEFIQQYWGEGAVMVAVDPGQAVSYLSNKLDIPSQLFRSPTQINAALQAIAQQAQQQQQSLPVPTTAPQQINNLQQPGPNL